MKLSCIIFGHSYYAAGWSSNTFDKKVPTGFFEHIFLCIKCRKRIGVLESIEDMKLRWDKTCKNFGMSVETPNRRC